MTVMAMRLVLLLIYTLGVTAIAGTATCASAAIIEIVVSGRVSVDDSRTLLPDEIRTGEPWTGLIRYDTSLSDQNADPKQGFYTDPLNLDGLSIAVTVHGHVFAGGNGELQAHILNDIIHDPNQPFNFPPGDSFSIGGPMQESPRLLDHSFISFSWNDPTGDALSDDSLPVDFDPFEFVQNDAGTGLPTYSPIYIRIEDMGLSTPTSSISYTVIASIESAEIRVIPEPDTWTLCGFFVVIVCSKRFANRLEKSERKGCNRIRKEQIVLR